MSFIQDFFNNNPVVAGIIFIVSIALLTLICIWIVFIIRRKNKLKEKGKQSNTNNQQINIVKKIDVEHFEYELNIAKNSNLIIKNLNNNDLNNLPTKDDFWKIINDENSKLYLPYDKVEILIDREQKKIITSKNISDHNLFIFNTFVRFMETSNMNWSKSKFK